MSAGLGVTSFSSQVLLRCSFQIKLHMFNVHSVLILYLCGLQSDQGSRSSLHIDHRSFHFVCVERIHKICLLVMFKYTIQCYKLGFHAVQGPPQNKFLLLLRLCIPCPNPAHPHNQQSASLCKSGFLTVPHAREVMHPVLFLHLLISLGILTSSLIYIVTRGGSSS